MTNTGGTPAGWYHAPGDPDGTQRYWDGAQWIGEPQATQAPAAPAAPAAPQAPAAPGDDATVAYSPPPQADAPPAYQAPAAPAPDYGQGTPQGAGAGYGVPAGAPGAPGQNPGNMSFGNPLEDSTGPMNAEFGPRAIALLIDWGIMVVGFIGVLILAAIGGAIADALGVLLALVGYLAVIGFAIWNLYIRQGSTGQSIGKEKQGIKLIKDETGQPVGGLMAFLRYLVAGLFGLLCGVGQLIDLLSPLWDSKHKRYSDKIMKMSVVKA